MTEKQTTLLREAQLALENMPMGGVGIDGACQIDLDVATARGGVCFDASYHQAQQAWLLIERAIMEAAL